MTEKKISGYVIHTKDILGKGSYGSVYRGEQDKTKKQVAVKVLEKKLINQDEYLKSALLSEVKILQLLKSENVIGVLDVMESTNNYYIIQQICDSDLQKYLKIKTKLPEGQAIRILRQICNGFIALVKQGIVHRDMKPANLLMSNGVIKIGDFGFAKQNITKRMKNQTTVGTPLYMPLQILKSEGYTSKCDIWAVGFIFYQMLHGVTPWTAGTQYELVKNIENKPLVISANVRPMTRDFLIKSLQKEQRDRMSWDEVFNHPIFQGYFQQYAAQSKKFQDKFKMVMTELRFQINSNNINLDKLLSNLHFKDQSKLNYEQFSVFIKHVHPDITKDQIIYFFQQIDEDGDGSINIKQLSKQMGKHYISFVKSESIEQQIFCPSSKNLDQSGTLQSIQRHKLATEVANKAKKCFVKLYDLITSKKLTLFQTFYAYSAEKKGQLTFEDFKKMLKRLDKTLEDEQLKAIFEYIDIDHSQTIEYEELSSYYCKVNGIPQSLDLPPQFKKKMFKKKQ